MVDFDNLVLQAQWKLSVGYTEEHAKLAALQTVQEAAQNGLIQSGQIVLASRIIFARLAAVKPAVKPVVSESSCIDDEATGWGNAYGE